MDNPSIAIQIVEGGGIDLRQQFLAEHLNEVILIESTRLGSKRSGPYVIQMFGKKLPELEALNGYQLAGFDKFLTI